MNLIEEKIFGNRKLARELYCSVVLDKETAIHYRILDQKSFDNLKKERDSKITKDGKYPTVLEYKREYKEYKIEVASCFGFTFYSVNILKPKHLWKKDNKFIVGELNPEASYPSIYNKPFGMEFRDLVRVQQYVKFNLEKLENLDCSDFIIEEDENWPCYFFKKDSNELMCISKKMQDKNIKFEKIVKKL